MGWNTNVNIPNEKRMVICIAPHTSNWDFIIGRLYYGMLGLKVSFLIKDFWTHGPWGPMMRALGAIGVDRSRHNSLTDQLAAMFTERNTLHLAITPEGTRKLNPEWKHGFYHIAMKAGVPILPVAIDFARREVEIYPLFTPTGDEENEINHIKSLYNGVTGRHPERFTTGNTY